MELLVALFFGIIQGVTEFLPISCGGHLALIQNVNQTMFGEELFSPTLTFDILLRLGTLMAIIFVFLEDIRGLWKAFLDCVKDIRQKEFSLRSDDPYRKLLYMLVFTAVFLIPAVFLTEITGTYLSGLGVIAFTLMVSGISNILIDKIGVIKHTNAFFEQNFDTEDLVPETEILSLDTETTAQEEEEAVDSWEEVVVLDEEIPSEAEVSVSVAEAVALEDNANEVAVSSDTEEEKVSDTESEVLTEEEIPPADEDDPKYFLKQAGIVGIFQLCSVIPGISRCSLNVLGGLFAGFRRDFTVKYAFLSTIPVLLAKILLQSATVLQDGIRMNWLPYLLGMLAAFFSGIFAIGLMRKAVRKYYCRRFGIYCLILGVIIFVIQLRG